jgi:hypothetical protein
MVFTELHPPPSRSPLPSPSTPPPKCSYSTPPFHPMHHTYSTYFPATYLLAELSGNDSNEWPLQLRQFVPVEWHARSHQLCLKGQTHKLAILSHREKVRMAIVHKAGSKIPTWLTVSLVYKLWKTPAAKSLYRSIFLDDDILLLCLYS